MAFVGHTWRLVYQAYVPRACDLFILSLNISSILFIFLTPSGPGSRSIRPSHASTTNLHQTLGWVYTDAGHLGHCGKARACQKSSAPLLSERIHEVRPTISSQDFQACHVLIQKKMVYRIYKGSKVHVVRNRLAA